MLNCFGVAASQSAGLRENFGTMTKPFQAGHAAESGLVAADLAALGWTAAQDILEAERGFFHAYGGSFDPAAIAGKLGKPWTFSSPGISLKPFPCGSLTHPAMTELLRLIQANQIVASNVEKVDVGTNRNMPAALIHHRPQTGLEAKFSMEYCLAILLLERKAGLVEFRDERVHQADVQEMLGRINFYVDADAENAGYDKMTSILKIHLKSGQTISGSGGFAKGSPSNPMSFGETVDKFKGCAEYARWEKTKTSRIINLITDLEKIPDVRVLGPLLAREQTDTSNL